ncbi:MAG: mevalonate kinase [Candidatus Thorarchaeota archaeon]|nr:mevalonate kinase [Candidatus Thorarchaeota archaeon]
MGTGTGKGKTILFGEHFVVYGYPAIAAGIADETIAKVTRKSTPGWSIDDRRPEMPGYKEKKLDEQKVSIENVIGFCGIDLSEQGIHIELGGELVCASGIGASAASCVAIARALNDEFDLGFDDERINEAAYEGEKGYHGTPSGIDNTASTFGGLVWYVRDLSGGPPLFEKIKLPKAVDLVIAATGLTASTTEVVGDVREKKETDPEWFKGVASEYDRLVQDARKALLDVDLKRVGELMNRNHELLQDLTVSCKELDALVTVARENGALGAKMTGTGRGGNMIALASDSASVTKIADALKKNGAAAVWITSFGL